MRCGIAATRWATQPQLAGLKLLARTEQVLAAGEAAAYGWDDMLMLDSDDHVISSGRANLFMLFGEKVATPCLDRCGIAGTRRELLLTELLPAMDCAVEIRPISLAECLSADALVTTIQYPESPRLRSSVNLSWARMQAAIGSRLCNGPWQRRLRDQTGPPRRLLLGALAAGAGTLRLTTAWNQALVLPAEGVVITVAKGESLSRVLARAEDNRWLIGSSWVGIVAQWQGLDEQIQAGEFALDAPLTAGEFIAKLVAGEVVRAV